MTDNRRTVLPRGSDSPGQAFSAQTWVSATFILIFTTLLSKTLGFVRDVLVANYFGASSQVDAFTVAVTLPTLVGGIGFALSIVFIPMYRKVLVEGGVAYGRGLVGGTVGFTVALSSLFAAITIVFSHQIVRLLAPSLAAPTLSLAAQLARWLAPLVLMLNLFYILGAIYNALEHFKIPAFTDLISNVCVLFSLVALSSVMGIRSLAVGMIGGGLVVALVMAVPLVLRRILPLYPVWNHDVQHVVILAMPVLMIEVLSQALVLVENFFGATLGSGNIAALGFARRLVAIVISLLASNVAKAVFPSLSRLVSEHDLLGARHLFARLTRQYAVAFIPLSIALMYLRHDIVRLVFMHGAFDAEAAERTSAAFLYYSTGLSLAALVTIFARACYAFGDTLVPLSAALLQLVVISVLNYFLTPALGLIGIALSASLAIVPGLILMGSSLTRRFGGIELGSLMRTMALALVCSIGALALLPGLNWWAIMAREGVVGLIARAMVYFTAYYGLCWFFMRQELRMLLHMLR